MKLTALGVWGGYATADAGTTSYLLQSESGYNLLIDAGSRAVTELEQELSPLWLDAVLISHYHEDHIADLGVLRQYRQLWPKDTMIPATKGNTEHPWDGRILPIYGHRHNQFEFDKLTLEGVSKGYALDLDQPQQIGPFEITYLKTVHPVDAYAMRIVEKKTGQVLVYTADTGWFEDLIPFSQHADLLLADVYFFKGTDHKPNHLRSNEAGYLANMAQVKRLVLTHLPQFGDLELLRQEAAELAGQIPVDLASPHRSWTL